MKKKIIYLSIIPLIGLILLSSYSQAPSGWPDFETLGTDNMITDTTDDIFGYSGIYNFEPTLEEVSWLDLVNATFETNGTHYSVSVSLNGGYHSNLTLYVYLEINGTEVGLFNTYFQVRIIGFNSYVQCQSALGIYADSGIAMLSANMITWTFPQENITNIIKNVRPISEWKVLVHSYGDYGAETYTDIMPNFSSLLPPGGIPGYSIIIIGLISCISLILIIKKIRISN